MKGVVIAGTASDSGKTTVTLGLMEAMRRRGLTVQAFKAGPDYIDAGHHGLLLGRPSYNLDTWMMGPDEARRTYRRHSAGPGVAVVEGVMGLFDGMDGVREEGSTAHLAKVLGLPVLLVVDGACSARSVAAVVKGFREFDPGVDLRWVVFNRLGGEGHYRILEEAVRSSVPEVDVLGYLPFDKSLSMRSRHLGLVASEDLERRRWKRGVRKTAEYIEALFDLGPLTGRRPARTARGAGNGPDERSPGRRRSPAAPLRGAAGGPIIAVARDRAFSFYYEENLEILRTSGARIRFFSPMRDEKLPRGTRGIYLGGGYPEVHAAALSRNEAMRSAVREAAARGMPVFAECGGLMYLGKAIIDMDGARHDMAGVFGWETRMSRRLRALGYRDVEVLGGCPFLEKGARIRGHEFRYSEMRGRGAGAPGVFMALSPSTGEEAGTGGHVRKNVLATYVHLHFASNPAFARGFVMMCKSL